MAGRTPFEAVRNYLAPLQRALSCITNAVLNVAGGYTLGPVHAAQLAGSPVKLQGITPLALSVIQHYRIVEDESPRGPWKVSIAGYLYTLEEPGGHEIITYHWHPFSGVPFPHLHLQEGAKVGFAPLRAAHIPTHRVAVEDVLRLAIAELGVRPQRDDWEEVLNTTQGLFEMWRTWPSPHP